MKRDIFFIRDNKDHRSLIIDSLCRGITNSDDLVILINYVLDKKLDMFSDEKFNKALYDGDDILSDLILPSVRRVWGKVFITPPTILNNDRLELFQLSFSIDDFMEHLLIMLPKVKTSLKHFTNLDRTTETITLIIDNYVAGLVKNTIDCKDHRQGIRDIKINKIIC